MTAPTTANFNTQPSEGFDFGTTYTVTTTEPAYPAPPVPVGTHGLGSNGSEYIFVKALTAIRRWSVVAIDLTGAASVVATKALVQSQQQIGFAQVAIAALDFGWVAIRGQNLGVLVKKGALAGRKCYLSTTSPGVLTTSQASSTVTSAYVSGTVLTTSCTSAMTGANPSAVVVAVATYPRALT